jgi:hypothetical protein
MIVPRLIGGLGNQMFVIAAAYSKSIDMNTELCINYQPGSFIGAIQGFDPNRYKNTLYKKIKETTYIPKNFFHEKDWAYGPMPDSDDMLITGYFQSEKNFKKHTKEVRELFCIPSEIQEKVNKALNKQSKKILGVHVRFGDYLKVTSDVHLVCDRDYYINALKQFNLDDYTVIVCTDDFENYQKLVNLDNVIVSNSKSELEDLYILSQCDDLIISNSTFAWWGSFLGKHKEKVCVPSRWFNSNGPKNYLDIYRDDWTIINVANE